MSKTYLLEPGPNGVRFIDEGGVTYDGGKAQDAFDAFIQGGRDFFRERGVDPAIIDGRPYSFWTPDNPTPLQEAWFPHISPTSHGWVTRVARQSAGYIIPRFAPPGLGLSGPSAEIRPLKSVDTRPGNPAKYIHCPGEGQATRLDLHPDALPLFKNATRVFFGIEGCIKADAILSQGEAVFSVPAVWQWDAPELAAFVERYLKGKTVFIVPDMDWHKNWQVITPAIQCRSALRGLGLENVFIAAPPVEAGEKGVDDFLGAGYGLDDLVVIGREMPDAFEEWAVRESRGDTRVDGVSRDAEVLQALSLCAGLYETHDGVKVEREGEIRKSIKPTARTITAINPNRKMGPRGVRRAIESLATRQGLTSNKAITVAGSLETQEPGVEYGIRNAAAVAAAESAPDDLAGAWWGNGWPTDFDWKDRPVITIAPELRAVNQRPIRLGDLEGEITSQRIEPFLHRDVSPERLKELRKTLPQR